jgi:nitroreductase
MMDYDGFLRLVQTRRTIRVFKPDPVPDELIDKIMEAARYAPSGGNSQPWEIVVVKDRLLRNRITEIMNEATASNYKLGQTRPREEQHPGDRRQRLHPRFQDAPVFFVLFKDRRLEDTYPLSAKLYRGESITTSSMSNVFLYMQLAATSLGLASQWLSATAFPLPQALIKQLLDVPRELNLYDTMITGYAAQLPAPRLVRAREDFTHVDRYDRSKYRTDEQVRKFIRAVHQGKSVIPA